MVDFLFLLLIWVYCYLGTQQAQLQSHIATLEQASKNKESEIESLMQALKQKDVAMKVLMHVACGNEGPYACGMWQ